MPVSSQDFYQSVIFNNESPEIDFRNNISRNHYSLLHYLIEYSEGKCLEESKYRTGSHQRVFDKVLEHLDSQGHAKSKAISAMFTNSKATRVKADYHIDKPVKYIDAAVCAKLLPTIQGILDVSS